MSTIRISAIICTFNRAEYLRKAIRSLLQQSLSKDDYEIIVVDNASIDRTHDVVHEELVNVQHMQYLYDPIKGLNQARNTGWQHAHGEYVAYLDDDAVAGEEWLEKILGVFEAVEPQPGCVGGKIEAIWEVARPTWLTDRMLLYLAIIDWHNKPGPLANPQFLAGANLAFPKRVIEDVGGFQSGIDRVGSNLLSNGDILIERQIHKLGYSCFYHPEIAVKHHITAARATQRWMISRFYWQGISDAVLEVREQSMTVGGRLRKGLRQMPGILLAPRKLINLILPTIDPSAFDTKCSTYGRIGYTLGLLGVVG